MPGLTADNVPARLFYYAPPSDGSKPRIYVSPPEGVPPVTYGADEHVVQIENVRGKEATFTLDNAGFLFGKYTPNHKAFSNDEEIEKEYYPESIDLIKRLTGASKVVLFDHTVRRRVAGETGIDPKKRGPVPRTHVDQTPSAAHNRVHRHLPEAEAKERLKHRFQIINLWRPISHPADDWPLAVCDFRSVNWENDLVPVELVYPDRVGETFNVKYNPEHKWKYLRGMTPEEFILIKCYDSVEDGSVAVLTPHTAFEDPATAAGTPPRQSIELRALVFYDD
ncbi:hypothetical protein E1B28_007225 [Marasmius oreades]|uniref:7alpha-cephem-methoxylase P8 chain n=1 Tax=Marasmius oreades TaxID=181124 RepID=A0A9P7S1G1_9AGAR|nr:uncharacterized protein E1B28_007225 [Marasmius oreades]KAG7093555.1 hypothetical protein E1B28_007225 [Marasmius oreades]